jgi:hypothetical protein
VPLGRPGHLPLKLVTRPGATEVGAYLRRGQQLDERRTVPGLGLTEHQHIKMIKRQMFGRAGLPLLRKRVLLTAQN